MADGGQPGRDRPGIDRPGMDRPGKGRPEGDRPEDQRPGDESAGRGSAGRECADSARIGAHEPARDTADEGIDAPAAALARARAAAAARGLRPGARPVRRRRPGSPPTERDDGRDPALIGDQVDRLVTDRGWSVDVAVGSVMGRWAEIVGPDVAHHCQPVTFEAGVLTVRADSTAWATQIRLLSSTILARLAQDVGPDTVTQMRVHGPSAPSWSRGPRRSEGPGPRDTYG